MNFNIKKENMYMSGIYKIQNLSNDKFYIGSAYNFYNRFRCHKSSLINHKHENQHLQNAFNKYGADNFIFEIIELVDIESIYKVEEEYLKKLYDKGVKCYNMTNSTSPEQLLKALNEDRKKIFSLISPDNVEIVFKGYRDAARQIDIDGDVIKISASIRLVAIGKIKCFKGWRLPINRNLDYKNYLKGRKKQETKTYDIKLVSPNNEIFGPITDLVKFSKENDITPSAIINLISGKTRYFNGWYLLKEDLDRPLEKNAKTFDIEIISPEGIVYSPISNLTKFCKTHKLNISTIRSIIFNKTKKDTHNGWKIKNIIK